MMEYKSVDLEGRNLIPSVKTLPVLPYDLYSDVLPTSRERLFSKTIK